MDGGGRWSPRPEAGMTIVELLMVLVMLGLAAGIAADGLRRHRDAAALESAADAARGRLAQARMLGVARRGVVELRVTPDGALELRGPDGDVVGVTPLVGGDFDLDSARLRPGVLRYNARGQAAPGSLYLYRRGRGVRIVSNFIGRLRTERFALP